MRGVALIAVLWLVALLTVLATAVATISVSQKRAAQTIGGAEELDAIADSAIRITLLRIAAPAPDTASLAAGTSQLQIFGTTATVTLERDVGRIDLNFADDSLLVALFVSNGWEDSAAQALVDHIGDWKDPDDQSRRMGNERGEYASANLRYEPRNGPFETVEELRQVLAAHEIGEEVLDALTVYSHAMAPLESAAPPAVKRALELAEQRRRKQAHSSSDEPPANTQTAPGSLVGEVVRIKACAHRQGMPERCRDAVARVTGSLVRPVQLFEWKAAR